MCNLSRSVEGGGEVLSQRLHVGLDLGGDGVLGTDDGINGGLLVGSLHVLQPGLGEVRHLGHLHAIGVALHADEEGDDDVLHLHGQVLALLEELVQTHTSVQLLLGGGVKIGTELGEGGHLTVLGKLQLHGTGDLLHGLDLSGGTHTGHGETHGNSGALALVEKLGLQEDLTVSDGNHVGGDIGGHITGLGLNDGQGGQGTGAEGIAHLGSALQETGVQVEHISGVSLTSRRAAEEQGHLTVSHGLLGEIVVEDHGVLAVVSEVLTHGAASVRSKVLQRSRVGGSGGHDDGVVNSLGLLEGADQLGNGGALLANADVDAHQLVLLTLGLLVDNGINGNGGLAGLAITNDQLTLTTANRNQGIDGLKSGRHGLVHGLSRDNSGGLHLRTRAELGHDGALAVDGLTETVDHAAKKLRADGDIHDSTGSLDGVTLKNGSIITEDHNTDVGVLEVESHTTETGREDNHLSSLALVEAIHTGNSISDGHNLADLIERSGGL